MGFLLDDKDRSGGGRAAPTVAVVKFERNDTRPRRSNPDLRHAWFCGSHYCSTRGLTG